MSSDSSSPCLWKLTIKVLIFYSQQLDPNSNWIIKLNPLTGEENNIGHLATMQCSAGKPWVLVLMWLPSRQKSPTNATPGRQQPPPAGQYASRNDPRKVTKGARCSPVLQIPHISISSSICWTCWNKSTEAPPCDPQGPKGPTSNIPGPDITGHPSEVSCPCLDKSVLFWWHRGASTPLGRWF